MNKRNLTLLLIALALMIGAAIYLFSGSSRSQLPPSSGGFRVRISYLPIAPDLPLFVAMDRGYFREEGLDVEPVKRTKSDEAVELIFTGQAEATDLMELYFLLSHEQVKPGGFKIYLMAAAEENTKVHQIIVRKDSDITTLAQLKGKKLGHLPGPQMKVFNTLILKNFMSDPASEVTLVGLSPDAQIPALESKSIDALFALEPIGTEAIQAGIAKTLAVNPLYQYLQKPFPASASVLSTEFIKNHPREAQGVVNAINKAIIFIESNPGEAKQSLVKWANVSPELAGKTEIYRYWTLPRIDRGAVQRYAQFLADNGVLPQAPDTSKTYYDSK
jgi:NitT/TauT family transport system substrate-binding protein